jgi:hypothetical protein
MASKYLSDSFSFPVELTSRKQWLCWRLWTDPGNPKLHKFPHNPTTGAPVSCDDPATWSTYEDAISAVRAGRYPGLGIVLSKDLGLAVLDLENCIDENQIVAEWAQREVEALDSYTEISASGKGLHVLVYGEVPAGQNKQKINAELFDTGKMFCLTGIIHENRDEIQSRDLSTVYERMQKGNFGPNYRPSFVVEKYNSQKFQDCCDDKWQPWFNDRSSAVQSVLWTLATKHNYDKDAIEREMENTAIARNWSDKGRGPGSKWERLKDKEIQNAIEGAKKHIGETGPAPLAFAKPEVPRDNGYVLLPRDKYDGWFPRGSVSLIAGSSGAGKTTLTVDMLVQQRTGNSYLGHKGAGLDYLLLFADRGARSNNETLERMGLSSVSPHIEHLPFCWGADAVAGILRHIEAQQTIPGVVFVEGADLLVENPNETPSVAGFLRGLQQVAEHYNIAIILSVGAPKMKGKDETYSLLRDRVYGSVAWGRTCDTIATLSIPGDGTGSRRSLDIQHRNAAAERFELEFCNGLLVLAVAKPEIDPLTLWANEKEWWSKADAIEGLKNEMAKSTVYRRVDAMLAANKVESKWENGAQMFQLVRGAE